MKKIFNEHSPYLIILTGIEIIFAIFAILAFVYQDVISSSMLNDVALLLENLYSQTWWGLTLLTLSLIGILSLTSIIYKKQEYHFISICLWFVLLIISININNSFKDILLNCCLFIPIIIINIIAYRKETNKLKTKIKKSTRK